MIIIPGYVSWSHHIARQRAPDPFFIVPCVFADGRARRQARCGYDSDRRNHSPGHVRPFRHWYDRIDEVDAGVEILNDLEQTDSAGRAFDIDMPARFLVHLRRLAGLGGIPLPWNFGEMAYLLFRQGAGTCELILWVISECEMRCYE